MYLQENAGSIAEAVAWHKCINVFDGGIVHHSLGFFHQSMQVRYQFKFFCGSQNHIHAWNLGDFIGLELGVTTNHHHIGIGVVLECFANHFFTFTIRVIRNAAGINHIQIGPILKFLFLKSRLAQLLSDRTAFSKIELAPKGIKGYG